MAMISVNNLTFGWVGMAENVFEEVSFLLDTDWRTGLIGRNGRGKTTLLRLLAETGGPARSPGLSPRLTHGGVITSPAGFRYFPYDIQDETQNTLAVVDAVCPDYEFWELCRELNLLDVPEDGLFRPFHSLSPGERTRVLLATLFLGRGDFVLLDEPTNHLDAEGKRLVVDYLRGKKGFLIVSHDRAVLDDVCDHILSIGKTDVEVVHGNYSLWAQEKQKRDNRNISENERLEKDIRKLQTAARRTADWSDQVEQSKYGSGPVNRGFIGHKAAKLMKRSKNMETRRKDAIEKKKCILKELERTGELKISPLIHHASRLVEIHDLHMDFLPDKTFQLLVCKGERGALTGGNGTGKSSLIKAIAGELVPCAGLMKIAGGLLISYVPQLTPDLSGSVYQFAEEAGIPLTRFLTILIYLGVERTSFDMDLSRLSDGQKRKVMIARSLCASAHLYIWDEPLNYLDILAREQIETLILSCGPTMIFVEHDAFFLRKIGTRTVLV